MKVANVLVMKMKLKEKKKNEENKKLAKSRKRDDLKNEKLFSKHSTEQEQTRQHQRKTLKHHRKELEHFTSWHLNFMKTVMQTQDTTTRPKF